MIRDHAALARLDHGLCALLNVMHLGPLVNLRPCGGSSARQTQGVGQRVQMRRAHVQTAAVIGGRGDQRAKSLGVHRLNLVIAIAILQVGCSAVLLAHFTGRETGVRDPRF